MPYDPSELPGEVLALRCYVAALIQVLPSSTRLLVAEAFETRADLVVDQLDESGKAGFARTATSLAVKPLAPAFHGRTAPSQLRGRQ